MQEHSRLEAYRTVNSYHFGQLQGPRKIDLRYKRKRDAYRAKTPLCVY